MNVQAVQAELNVKLGASKAFQLMNEFTELASLYPAAHIAIPEGKRKREKAVADMSDKLYPFHTPFTKPLNNYGNSVILIGCDRAVPYMLEEVAEFVHYIEQFYKGVKPANSVQEMQPHYKQFTLKGKQLIDAMLEDLEMYAAKHSFKADRGVWMSIYKDAKAKLN